MISAVKKYLNLQKDAGGKKGCKGCKNQQLNNLCKSVGNVFVENPPNLTEGKDLIQHKRRYLDVLERMREEYVLVL